MRTTSTARQSPISVLATAAILGAINQIANPARITTVELALESVAAQKRILTDEKFEIVQGDMATVKVAADFIYLVGVIQHTADMQATLRNAWACLNDGGEVVVSFYMWTAATVCLEPVRQVMRRLPKPVAWAFAHVLAPIFMVRRAGREAGYKNAVHTAYDWNGSHAYQHYSTRESIDRLFRSVGIDELCVHRLANKGNYRLKKYSPQQLAALGDSKMHRFGAD